MSRRQFVSYDGYFELAVKIFSPKNVRTHKCDLNITIWHLVEIAKKSYAHCT